MGSRNMVYRKLFLMIVLLSSSIASSAWQDLLTIPVMKNSAWASRIGGGAIAGVGAVACSLSLPAVVASALLGTGIGHLWNQNEKTIEDLREANRLFQTNTERVNAVGLGLEGCVSGLKIVESTLSSAGKKVIETEEFQKEAEKELSGAKKESCARNEKMETLSNQLIRINSNAVAARKKLELSIDELKKQQEEAAGVAAKNVEHLNNMNKGLRTLCKRQGIGISDEKRDAAYKDVERKIQAIVLANLTPVFSGTLKKAPVCKKPGALAFLLRKAEEGRGGSTGSGIVE